MKKTPTDLDEGTIRRIDWPELIPAVILPQAFPIAVSFRILWLSTLGVLLTIFLGFLINGINDGLAVRAMQRSLQDETGGIPPEELARGLVPAGRDRIAIEKLSELANVGFRKNQQFRAESLSVPGALESADTVLYPWKLLSDSAARVVPIQKTMLGNVFSLVWFLGVLSVWTLIGGIITRSAAVRLTVGQHERLGKINDFMNWRWKSYFAVIFLPMIAMLLCALGIWVVGLLSKIVILDVLLAVVFPLIIFAGFCFSILGIGLLFGWPLSFAAISVDGSDGFDAVSRSFSYIFQRPLHYIFYVICGLVIGAVGWFFVAWFIDLTLAVIAGWGGFAIVDFSTLHQPKIPGSQSFTPLSLKIVSFWCWCFQLMKVGYLFGYFWICSTAIYLILRRSVDGTPFDQVRFYPNEPTVKKPSKIISDAKGAPRMQKEETFQEEVKKENDPG